MEFVKVESWKDAEAGFGDGSYGPETLGIKFPLSEKKKAAGETKSEYHYGGVESRIYLGFMGAENAESYFRHNIKPFPERYPFVKVEAESVVIRSDGKVIQGGIDTEPITEIDPGSALALIDTMEDDKLFAPGGVTDAQLEAGRQWYLAEAKKRDISTEKSRAEFKRFARPLQKLRTGIEARAKELTGTTKRKIAAIDTEKRRLVQRVGDIEDEVLGPLTAWEQEEESRKIGLANIVKEIEAKCDFFSYHDIESLEAAIDEVESFDVTTMQEYRLSAESAKEAVLRRLRPELERRKVAERDAAELAELRRKQAEREEADRKAEQQRQEDERIAAAAKKLADAQIQQAVETAKVETRQEVIAELAAPVAEDPFVPFVYPPAPVRTQGEVFTETREQVFNREAVAGLIGHVNLDRQTAIRVLTAIKAGNVPHITITY